jgi:hypothetical protein
MQEEMSVRVKVDKEEVRRKLRAGQFSEGCFCKFIRFESGNLGAKVYRTQRQARLARRAQDKAHKCGLAPKAYQTFSLSAKRHGYITEVVKLRPNTSEKRLLKLENELFEAGITHNDLHSDNVGVIGKGLVCIDFDPRGCSIE